MNECMDRVGLLISYPYPSNALLPSPISHQVRTHNMEQVNETQEVSQILIHILYSHRFVLADLLCASMGIPERCGEHSGLQSVLTPAPPPKAYLFCIIMIPTDT